MTSTANSNTGWKKYYQTVKIKRRPEQDNKGGSAIGSTQESWLGNYYQGSPDRIPRYTQYDHMDNDVDVNIALDTTTEFCTIQNSDPDLPVPFKLRINETIDNTTSELLRQSLRNWCNLNKWNSRIFDTVRNTLKYGDQVFIRDPDTFELHWVDIYNVNKVLVNEYEGKKPEYYYINNIAPNLEDLVATGTDNAAILANNNGSLQTTKNKAAGIAMSYGSSYQGKEYAVNAVNVVHISLSSGMDNTWPFGKSILDSSFKPFKQKELLEDAIIIYRVQRSPERLVFNVDVGEMGPKKSFEFLKEVKNEIRQKRVPVIDRGEGKTVMDTTYSPMAMTDDFFFSKNQDGRGTTVETLPGGESTGNIEDLKFFSSRLWRSLRIPKSYLSFPMDDSESATYNDGKVGTAYMDEYRFSIYCTRLQRQIIKNLNREFKLYIKSKDLDISANEYDIFFTEPESFSEYRDIERDTAQLGVFQSIADVPYLSTRYKLERYLKMSQDQIKRNEKLWMEERNVSFNIGKYDLGEVGVNVIPDDDIDDIEETEDNDEDFDFSSLGDDDPANDSDTEEDNQ